MFLISSGHFLNIILDFAIFYFLLDFTHSMHASNSFSNQAIRLETKDTPLTMKHSGKAGEQSDLYEGDIRLTPQQRKALDETTNGRRKRKITADLTKRWKLPIKYSFDGTHNQEEMNQIRDGIRHWTLRTCIQFVEVAHSSLLNESIVFTKGEGCWSAVGYVSYQGIQQISIGPQCLWIGTVVHELGHALGFWHEQARPDRDDHVTILLENVKSGRSYNFQRSSWGEVTSLGVPYDVGSLMHYGSKFFSKNHQRTIETKDPRLQKVLGQRDELSFLDAKLANLAYCSDICLKSQSSPKCQNDGYADPLNCSTCRCPDGLGGRICDTVAPSTQSCGGVLTAGHQGALLRSPGYPVSYKAGLVCHWLIQAPPGYRVHFEFTGQFNLTEDKSDDTCENFLEVRYYDTLANTGARFCGSERPADTMTSQSDKMLLLMKTQEVGPVGFMAKYRTESCGGCLSDARTEQKACVRTVTYPCVRRWMTRTRAPCITWWSWMITDCGYKYQSRTREDVCERTERYCCENFHLQNDTCWLNLPNGVEEQIPEYTGTEKGKAGNETEILPAGWSTWSSWSKCTDGCGGCGRQTRKRQCSDPVFCAGLEKQEQSQSCNVHVCPKSIVQLCTKKKAITKICNPWTLKTCTTYVTQMSSCHHVCCKDYVQVGDRCIKSR